MNSIRRKLLFWLLAAVMVAGLAAAWGVYKQARTELDELFDYHLRQMALSLRDGAFGMTTVDPEELATEFDFSIQIWGPDGTRLYFSQPNVVLPGVVRLGYDDVDTRSGRWRVFAIQARGSTIQVAQPMRIRNRLAANSALRTLIPFFLLLPVLGLLVWFTVGRELRPLESVARAVGRRSAAALAPLPDDHLPVEVKPLVDELNHLLERLGRSLEVQREFVADAAHELRTPLTALRLQMQLAERARDESERKAAFDTLRGGLDRAIHVVEQLLTLARQAPEAVSPEMVPVDLATLVREVVSSRSPIAENRSIDLGVSEAAAITLRGDPDGLYTALANLVDNALRHVPRGGRIDVGLRREGGDAVLEVIDNGPGIPPPERERVFRRFYRRSGAAGTGDSAGGGSGSGLGLAIVREIAQRHGATIALDDAPAGQGLAARLRIPVTN